MRLIETTDFTFKVFNDTRQLPDYAILSHCWSMNAEEEVSYQAFHNRAYDEDSSGWCKIRECCRIAQARGLKWAWVDTCCINKESSAELNEAINSMFEWYRLSAECYVFLPDVHLDWSIPIAPVSQGQPDGEIQPLSLLPSFYVSRWFTRGWTLQELLAPYYVEFFNDQYGSIGTRESLAAHIEHVTGIDKQYLLYPDVIQSASIAQRMFWVAKRETGRGEDIAYSLLGIFGVNMPLIYGEGRNAFFRLQKAIIEDSNDESIFAWGFDDSSLRGVLATSPSDVATSKDIFQQRRARKTDPFRLTNRGVEYHYDLFIHTVKTLDIALNCTDGRLGDRVYLQLVLSEWERPGIPRTWVRAGITRYSEPGTLRYVLSRLQVPSLAYLSVASQVLRRDALDSRMTTSRWQRIFSQPARNFLCGFTSFIILISDLVLASTKPKGAVLFIAASIHLALQLIHREGRLYLIGCFVFFGIIAMLASQPDP